MRRLVEYIVKGLVDHPQDVEVAEIPLAESTVYEIHVAPSDLGKVIGKGGRVANAIRAVAKAVAQKDRRRVAVEIAD